MLWRYKQSLFRSEFGDDGTLSRSSLMIKKRFVFGLYREEIALPEACFGCVCKLRLTREEAKQVTMNSLQT